ncbi:polysaccharide biosynthesis protein, partial [Candidatus Roizmanbacteria bacterium CG_4_10_14_0_8_um_filter_35_28]
MDDLKKKTIISTLSLFFQSGYSAFLGLVANLVLTILLSPAIFGIYIATLSIISIFNYFSDIGMAASLIQKKEIDRNDERTVFTVQQLLI